jgi:hypothetical protein
MPHTQRTMHGTRTDKSSAHGRFGHMPPVVRTWGHAVHEGTTRTIRTRPTPAAGQAAADGQRSVSGCERLSRARVTVAPSKKRRWPNPCRVTVTAVATRDPGATNHVGIIGPCRAGPAEWRARSPVAPRDWAARNSPSRAPREVRRGAASARARAGFVRAARRRARDARAPRDSRAGRAPHRDDAGSVRRCQEQRWLGCCRRTDDGISRAAR